MKKDELVKALEKSSEIVGEIYPVLLDYHGNLIDGANRLRANPDWRTVKLEHIKTKKERLIAKISCNVLRRTIPKQEKEEIFNELAIELSKEGIEKGKIAGSIAKLTGVSEETVRRYLSDKFKDKQKQIASLKSHYARKQIKETAIKGTIYLQNLFPFIRKETFYNPKDIQYWITKNNMCGLNITGKAKELMSKISNYLDIPPKILAPALFLSHLKEVDNIINYDLKNIEIKWKRENDK